MAVRLPAVARRRQIARIVRREPYSTAEEIGAITRLGRAAVRLYLLQLQQAGIICAVPSCVAERGRRGPPPFVWVSR